MTTNPLTLLPAKARKAVYITYGALSLAGTGITAYYTALPNLTVPDPVIGGLAVLGALAAPIAVLAGSNTPDSDEGHVADPLDDGVPPLDNITD